MNNELPYQLSLSNIAGIGPARARALLQRFGSASAIFQSTPRDLAGVEGISLQMARMIKSAQDAAWVERELRFIEKHDIGCHFFTDPSFPKRLRHIEDPPLMLYSKGNVDLMAERKIGIIGTRQCSQYGSELTAQIVAGLLPYNVQVYSGLAFGIDVAAHRAAMRHGIPTVGVVAHGLHELYPAEHRRTASEMQANGGLITEYGSQAKMERYNFPMRNRIVAGICDAILVVETSVKGGSMITAKLASSYHREVFAVPGRVGDTRSAGCHYLIRTNIAGLVTNAAELAEGLGWEEVKAASGQPRLFEALSADEEKVVAVLQASSPMHIDELMLKSGRANSALAQILLQLELQGVVASLAGKRYKLI